MNADVLMEVGFLADEANYIACNDRCGTCGHLVVLHNLHCNCWVPGCVCKYGERRGVGDADENALVGALEELKDEWRGKNNIENYEGERLDWWAMYGYDITIVSRVVEIYERMTTATIKEIRADREAGLLDGPTWERKVE